MIRLALVARLIRLIRNQLADSHDHLIQIYISTLPIISLLQRIPQNRSSHQQLPIQPRVTKRKRKESLLAKLTLSPPLNLLQSNRLFPSDGYLEWCSSLFHVAYRSCIQHICSCPVSQYSNPRHRRRGNLVKSLVHSTTVLRCYGALGAATRTSQFWALRNDN